MHTSLRSLTKIRHALDKQASIWPSSSYVYFGSGRQFSFSSSCSTKSIICKQNDLFPSSVGTHPITCISKKVYLFEIKNSLPFSLQHCRFLSLTDPLAMADNKYIVGYAKLGTSSCKKCKVKIDKGGLRIGKVTPNPFSDDGDTMKQWFHPSCIFETFVRARATTKKIEDPDDAEGFDDLRQEDKDTIRKLIDDFQAQASKKGTPKKPAQSKLNATSTSKITPNKKDQDEASTSSSSNSAKTTKLTATNDDPKAEKDNSFRQFRRLCAEIAEENSYLEKTKLVQNYITKGNSGDGFHGDLFLLMKHLLPGVVKSVYNLNNKQLVKLFSNIFGSNLTKMVEDLDNGDVAETIRIFYEESKYCTPPKKSTLSLQEVDDLLNELSLMTREDDQQRVLSKITKRSTANDLKMVIRLIKHDLRINSGAKHILDALDPNAHAAFQASKNLKDVVDRVLENRQSGDKPGLSKKLSIRASLMTPVQPMLAEACRSVEQAMKKCPNGFYAEIKYDGERVQVHKQGAEFKYYSRSLKPVLDHKVRHFKEFIPKAFPNSSDLILDAEVLLVDTDSGSPLPFGTLGVHKKAEFKDAKVCLFIFDCLLINGTNLMERPIKQRRKVLEKSMTSVKNRVHLSETQHITKPSDLQGLMSRVFKEGLEGLVLKDVNGTYEPGKRHWLKVKKDYLNDGSMADSADLVVLGAYYGTGNKGGMMSIFLMGVYDPGSDRWLTVSKCGSGFDDKKLEELNKDLDMVKISKDMSKVPRWLNVSKSLAPDFIARDPKKSPVWEIIGAEFSKAEIHTAGGISIRFPRVQKFRDDKGWSEATDLPRLKVLFAESKEKSDLNMQRALGTTNVDDDKDEDGAKSDGTEVMSDDDDDDDNSNGSNKNHTTPSKPPSFKKNGKKEEAQPSSSKDMGITQQRNKRAASASSDSCPVPSKKSLPSFFQGCRIVIPSNLDNFKQLKRYVLAFDGDVLHEFDSANATHIVVSPAASYTNASSKAIRVSEDWLWCCITKRRRVPTQSYSKKVKQYDI